MPLVIVAYDPEKVLDPVMGGIIPRIAAIVAEELNSPDDEDGKLTIADIEVWPKRLTAMDFPKPGSENAVHVGITIFANDFPIRKATLKERREKILERVRREFHSSVTGFVWIALFPAEFGTF